MPHSAHYYFTHCHCQLYPSFKACLTCASSRDSTARTGALSTKKCSHAMVRTQLCPVFHVLKSARHFQDLIDCFAPGDPSTIDQLILAIKERK